MSAMTVDAAAMRIAIPAVENLIQLLESGAASLAGVDVPDGVPAGVAAQVRRLAQSASELRAAARDLDSIPDQLLRRVSAAQLAESPALQVAGWSVPMFTFYAKSFSMRNLTSSIAGGMAARDIFTGWRQGQSYGVRNGVAYGGSVSRNWRAWRMTTAAARGATSGSYGVPRGLLTGARVAGKAVTVVGWGATAYTNFRNPYLSTEQKVARTGAAIATGAGVSVLAGAAAGAAFGSAAGPVGTLVGFGAGAAWAFADSKFHVSDTIGDAAADAAGAVGGAAKSVANKVGGFLGL